MVTGSFFYSCKRHDVSNYHTQLENGWKFKIDDSVAFAQPTYNDLQWKNFIADTTIYTQGYSYNNDNYCWYRMRFFISSDLKKNAFLKDSLKIYLGMIGSRDQVFLNGYFIGQNNKSLPINIPINDTFTSIDPMNTDKIYFLSSKDKRIHWDSNNVLAIRVFDSKFKKGFPYFSMKGIEDYIQYNKGDFYKPNTTTGKVDTVLTVKNISSNITLKGIIEITAENCSSRKKVYENKFVIDLKPNVSKSYAISLPFTTENTNIYFQYVDDVSSIIVKDSIIVPFVLVKSSKSVPTIIR